MDAAVNLLAPSPTGDYATDVAMYSMPGLPNILCSAVVQVFPMGLICGIHFDAFKRLGRWPYLAAAALGFVVSLPFADFSAPKLLTLGISASCVILATADLDIYFRVVKKLGDASYGVYLLHFPAIVLVSKMTTNVFLLFLTGMFFGTLFGLFDHRMYRWLTAPWARPASAPVP